MSRPQIKTVKLSKRLWKLTEKFKDVPKGFISNGASVPRLLWWFLDPATEAFEAAVVHDHALHIKDARAHNLFLKTLLEYEVSKYKAYPAYWAVCVYHFVKGLFK